MVCIDILELVAPLRLFSRHKIQYLASNEYDSEFSSVYRISELNWEQNRIDFVFQFHAYIFICELPHKNEANSYHDQESIYIKRRMHFLHAGHKRERVRKWMKEKSNRKSCKVRIFSLFNEPQSQKDEKKSALERRKKAAANVYNTLLLLLLLAFLTTYHVTHRAAFFCPRADLAFYLAFNAVRSPCPSRKRPSKTVGLIKAGPASSSALIFLESSRKNWRVWTGPGYEIALLLFYIYFRYSIAIL